MQHYISILNKSVKYNIIAAHCNKYGIGINNKLPWHYKEDLKYFSKITTGNKNNAVIMGYNTMLSLPNNHLPNRTNFCLTSKSISNTENMNFFKTPEILDNYLSYMDFDNIWVIGGSQIYNYYINSSKLETSQLYLTHIHKDYKCDSYFPNIENLNKYYLQDSIIKNENNTKLEFKVYGLRFLR